MKKGMIAFLTILLFFALPVQSNTYAYSFQDVPNNHRFADDIRALVNLDIIDDGKRFGIDDKVTRGEVAMYLARLDAGQKIAPTSTQFKDVNKNHPYAGYIQYAVKNGLLSGYPDGTFRPNAIVTRGQMAIFLSRSFDFEPNPTETFKDVGRNMKAFEAIQMMVGANVTAGFPDGTFRPNNQLTRGQVAAFLNRAIDYSLHLYLDGAFFISETPDGDLPPAEYIIHNDHDTTRSFTVSSHWREKDVTINVPAEGHVFAYLEEGTWLDIEGLTVAPAEIYFFHNESGVYGQGEYRVGIDIPAGTYLAFPLNGGGYIAIHTSSNPFDDFIFDELSIDDVITVTVEDGEYLYLNDSFITVH